MCGIYGFNDIRDNGKELLRTMAGQQLHRGPNSEGHYIDLAFGFGIRRLSVIDLETGDQPICNEDKSVWVVCNGEIYNYHELTTELKEKGHNFRTKSDVECIVHLYEEHGIGFLEHLNGMFGLALYDAQKKCLYIARDRLGIKPMYYSELPGCFLFASELRSLLATQLIPKELNWKGLSFFLDNMYIPTPLSPFSSILKLKPGHYIKLDGKKPVVETAYWKLEAAIPAQRPSSLNEAIDRLTFLFRDSNRLQIKADVPICAFLSGGVDSSAVVAFAAMQASLPLRTFNVFFENAIGKIDERPYARAVSSRYGTIHSEVVVSKHDFKRLIPRLIWHLEEPFGDLASVPTYVISEMARREATVCLNGSGGDELFAGYHHHRRLAILKNKILSSMNTTGLEQIVRSAMGKSNNPGDWNKLFPLYLKSSLRRSPADWSKSSSYDMISRELLRDIDCYLQSNILFLLDKVTMAVSLEGRVPLLDHRFVELAAGLPSKWKIRHGENKYIFKKMLEPYLPLEVLYRKKEGFGAPLSQWLDNETRAVLYRIVEHGLLVKNQLLRPDNATLKGLNNWDLWKVACMELWYRIIFEFSTCPEKSTLEDFAV